jgi:hypothetical protein
VRQPARGLQALEPVRVSESLDRPLHGARIARPGTMPSLPTEVGQCDWQGTHLALGTLMVFAFLSEEPARPFWCRLCECDAPSANFKERSPDLHRRTVKGRQSGGAHLGPARRDVLLSGA